MTRSRQLPPGVYYDPKSGRFIAKQKLGGKMTRAITFDTPAQCVEHNAIVRAEFLAHEAPLRSKGITLGEWLDRWLKRRAESGRHRDVPHDRAVLARYVGDDLRSKALRELRARDVRSWLYDLAGREAHVGGKVTAGTSRKKRGRKLSRQTVANALNLLRTALADAVDAGKLSSNPAVGLRPPRDAATTHEHTGYLSAEQVDALLDLDLSTRTWAIFAVAMFTGLRAGELWGLRWEDVVLDGDRPELVVRRSYAGPTKGGRVRRVPLLAQAREALRTWRATLDPTPIGGLVWPTHDKDGAEKCHPRGYDAEWKRWAPRAGVDMPLKQARHTCGCHLVIGTWGPPMPLEAVQAWLGHKSITTTERFYARYQPGRLHAYRAAIDDTGSAQVQRTEQPKK